MEGADTEEGEWKEVSHRKRKVGANEEPKLTSFFITNFPHDWSGVNLRKAFANFGRLVDVYVARKKTKNGRRFGFLRFDGIRNPETFGRLLDGVPVGNLKAKVNIARYERKPISSLPKIDWQQKAFRINSKVVDERSYASALAGKRNEGVPIAVSDPKPVLSIPLHDTAIQWINRNLVAKVNSYNVLCNLDSTLKADGCGNLKIRYLGGFQVLLEFVSESAANAFLLEANDSWSNWFTSLDKWSPDTHPVQRLVSLVISGVPPQVWLEEVFLEIGKLFGEVILNISCDDGCPNMAYAKIGVLTAIGDSINTSRWIKVGDHKYFIRIMEDTAGSLRLMPSYSISTHISDSDDDSKDFEEDGVQEDSDSKIIPDSPFGSPDRSSECSWPATPCKTNNEVLNDDIRENEKSDGSSTGVEESFCNALKFHFP